MNPMKVRLLALCIAGLRLTACATSETPATSVEVQPSLDANLVTIPTIGKAEGAKAFGLKALTLDELTTCAVKAATLHHEEAVIRQDDGVLKRRMDTLNVQQQELESRRTRINYYNQRDVDAYNMMAKQQNGEAKQYNVDVAKYNKRLIAADGLVNDFNASCAQRAFRKSDRDKLLPGLRAALDANSTDTDMPLRGDDAIGSPDGASNSGPLTW